MNNKDMRWNLAQINTEVKDLEDGLIEQVNRLTKDNAKLTGLLTNAAVLMEGMIEDLNDESLKKRVKNFVDAEREAANGEL